MPTLTDLAIKYGCDKYYAHSYIPFYEKEFAPYHDRIISLLEIGIGYEDLMRPFVPKYVHGASLKMWRDYFPFARIVGCDVRRETLFDADRILTYWIDQSDPKDLWQLAHRGPYSIIIDDGSHEMAHQILTASVLVPWLNPGGVYVIEDVQEPERVADALGGEIHRFNKRPDDVLVVVRRWW